MPFRKPSLTAAIFLAGVFSAASVGAGQALQPEHFIDYSEIRSVYLSPDGERIIASTRRADPVSNETIGRYWLIDSHGDQSPRELELPEGARSLAWHPDGERLALLAPADNGNQVHLGRPGSQEFEAITEVSGGIRAFELGPEGRMLAFTTTHSTPADHSGERSERRGVNIDMAHFGMIHLLSGRLEQQAAGERKTQLHLMRLDDGEARTIAEDHSVTGFAFSPDGNRLALSAIEGPQRAGGRPHQGADLLVHDRENQSLETLAEGQGGKDDSMFRGRVSHRSPFWSPSGDRLGYIRTDHSRGLAAVSALGIHDFDTGDARLVTDATETELGASGIAWHQDDRILIERTNRARRGLYSLALDDGSLDPVRASLETFESFSFSDSGERAAWVEQATSRPPEIFFGDPIEDTARQLTEFNSEHAARPLNEIEQVSWRSEDGQEVFGWLLQPSQASAEDPAPLVTMLAGGPSFVIANRYRLYPRPVWPYPLQVMVDRGYAVLIVHYRGTSSFGPDFRMFSPGENDVADVHAGVRSVGQRDRIDADRLGIMGHSHGAWLGPMAADGGPEFRAASFAEGLGNFLSVYLALDGQRNIDLHEPGLGGTPWENPQRYLDVSPAFQSQLIENTPTLIEAGEQASSFEAMQLAKAFWRHDTPHELVIYPDTGHNIREPEVMLESMQRNLEWFETWLPVD